MLLITLKTDKMKQVNNLSEIKDGEVLVYTSQFGSNEVMKLSDDYTGMNRDIAYFKFNNRGIHLTPDQFKANPAGFYGKMFAIWQFNLNHDTLYRK